jgi:Cof subfamily protein (haloacid dehalogenase superfamily)
MVEQNSTQADRWLIALDIDGTVMHEDGDITRAVIEAVHHVRDAGHEVMLATGRSVAMTLPVLDRLGISPEYVVCSNGAITLIRDADAPTGYARIVVDSFDPTNVLNTVRGNLENASYAVEDEEGLFYYCGQFPDETLGAASIKVEFQELMGILATRVVVISPGHDIDDFVGVVERMGLRRVTYTVGWTAWLDIAPDGVNKATALERVRDWHGVPRSRVLVIGDGRNDIDMLEWASVEGRGIAMGHAPDEVRDAANEFTGTELEDGVASVLAAF